MVNYNLRDFLTLCKNSCFPHPEFPFKGSSHIDRIKEKVDQIKPRRHCIQQKKTQIRDGIKLLLAVEVPLVLLIRPQCKQPRQKNPPHSEPHPRLAHLIDRPVKPDKGTRLQRVGKPVPNERVKPKAVEQVVHFSDKNAGQEEYDHRSAKNEIADLELEVTRVCAFVPERIP
jgi:hypothetical protein